MGDRPWQQPPEQASYPHAGMIQAASSSAHGGIIRKEPGGGYDMAEFDQALFLYLNSQDQTSAAHHQDQPQTLNIFPSQPMHIAEPAPKGSMGTSNTAPIAGAGPSKQPPPPSNHPSRPTPAALKDGKPAGVKREGSSGAATGSGTPSTSNQQEGPRTPDAKTLRRLAQNREAARKSRLRKKAYIQNLETSRIRLSQLEQELHRSRNQGAVFGGGALSGSNGGLSPEAAWFDMEHARWQEEHGKMMRHLRAALEAADQQHPAAPAPAPAAEEVDEQAERREDLKRCLVDTVYGSELGFRASTEVRGEVVELVTQLEAVNPTPAPVEAPDLLDGNWILIYTAYSELLPILAAGATPFVKVKQISQEIDSKSMTIVNASTLTTPFASFSFSATASFEVQSPSRIEVQFKEGSFQPPAISSTVDLPEQVDIFGQKISLGPVQQVLNPLQQTFASIAGSISGQPPLKVQIPGNNRGRSWLLTTYLDKDFRISRGDGGLFILAKEGSPFLDQL